MVEPRTGPDDHRKTRRNALKLGAAAAVVWTTPIVVSTPAAAQGSGFVNAPVLFALLPEGGPTVGGVPVSLSGTFFTGATSVTFGGIPATFVVDSDVAITAFAPAHPAGVVAVTVTNPGGTSNALQFTYV